MESGLGEPAAVTAASAEYRAETDSVEQWWAECVEESPGSRTKIKELYVSYVNWCKATNEKPKVKNQFHRAMKEHDWVNTSNVPSVKDVRINPHLGY